VEKLTDWFRFLTRFLEKGIISLNARFPSRFVYKVEQVYLKILTSLLSFLRLGYFTSVGINKRENVRLRALVIVDEAVKRGYVINVFKFLHKPTEIFRLDTNRTSLFFHTFPPTENIDTSYIDFDDKHIFKSFLKSYNFPHLQGKVVASTRAALRAGHEIGFPLVVKPRHGSLSRHTTVNIRDDGELIKAIKIVQMIAKEFIVERYISGGVYRVVVVRNKMVACALREAPYVVGDGVCNIKDLVRIRNINYPSHPIKITPKIISFLRKEGKDISTVPMKGEYVYLNDKVVLAGGACVRDVTDLIHSDNVDLLEKVSSKLKTGLVGFDIITEDISLPYHKLPFAIIEANSAPYIDMHHFPDSGKGRNIAAPIIDLTEELFLH